MELADDIAYGIHDMEDAIVTGVVVEQDFRAAVIDKLAEINDTFLNELIPSLSEKLFSDYHYKQKEAIGSLVNYLITSIEVVDSNETKGTEFSEPLLRFQAQLPPAPQAVLQVFKDFVFAYVIKQPNIQRLEYRGQQIVMELFEALASDPKRLLPTNTAKRWQQAGESGLNQYRVISDYVSGMTDEYATRLYKSLFSPNSVAEIAKGIW